MRCVHVSQSEVVGLPDVEPTQHAVQQLLPDGVLLWRKEREHSVIITPVWEDALRENTISRRKTADPETEKALRKKCRS